MFLDQVCVCKYRSGIQLYINISKETEKIDVRVSKTTFLHIFKIYIFKRSPFMTINYKNILLNEEIIP